jgi:glycosyltransferase involved in cell wall biosynthesis
LCERGAAVDVYNVPLGYSTAARVDVARRPWRALALLGRIGASWLRLLWRSRGCRPAVVVVGYLGQFDVLLARLRFPRSTIVLDHLVGLGDTVRDRRLARFRGLAKLLDLVDDLAARAAHVVLVDTAEQGEQIAPRYRAKVVVVPVGAPRAWFDARPPETPSAGPLRVVFFGSFTPLQGAIVVAEAIGRLTEDPIRWTLIGRGQDFDAVEHRLRDVRTVEWVEWVPPDVLPSVVASHDVCLGIFGDSPKARRVVPNKAYQGAAAGCALVTSDTPVQRRALVDGARYAAPGCAESLAQVLHELAGSPDEVAGLRRVAGRRAVERFTPREIVRPLWEHCGMTS